MPEPHRAPDRRTVLDAVEEHLTSVLGEPDGRAAVTFLGTERIEVLRFRGGESVRYATLGLSARPMTDPAAYEADPVRGPRAELVLTLREPRDEVLRALAVLAAAPEVEGLVLGADASVDLGEPLWPGAPYTAVLLGEPGSRVPDLPLPAPADPVAFLPVHPLTPNEAALKRAGRAGVQGGRGGAPHHQGRGELRE